MALEGLRKKIAELRNYHSFRDPLTGAYAWMQPNHRDYTAEEWAQLWRMINGAFSDGRITSDRAFEIDVPFWTEDMNAAIVLLKEIGGWLVPSPDGQWRVFNLGLDQGYGDPCEAICRAWVEVYQREHTTA